jgi:ABC-type transporter MlaC component
MGGNIGIPVGPTNEEINALPIQSPTSAYDLRNASLALNNPQVAPPPQFTPDQSIQELQQNATASFLRPQEQYAQPQDFSQQQQQFQQPQFQQLQGPDQFTPYEQQIQARQAARQRQGSGLKGLLVGAMHGMGTAMMHNAGLLTPEEQDQRDASQMLAIQNARMEESYKNLQAQQLALKMRDRFPVTLANGQTVMVTGQEAAQYNLGQQQLEAKPGQKIDLAELYTSSVMNDMRQGLTSPSQTTLNLKQAHADWENKQVSVADRELADYLKDPNVDKGVPLANRNAATHAAWKARLSPLGLVMGNQLGPAGPGTALDQMAENYWQTGQLPSGFARSPGTLTAVANRAAALHPDSNLAGNKAVYKADSTALTPASRSEQHA